MSEKVTTEELKQRAIAALRKCQNIGDIEAGHSTADEVLCGLLDTLGFSEVVKEWDKVSKWYA